ncbi:MAG: tRNA (adenosine(37)-N6)-dimethylallyltransferase MiaA [Candidatus Muiribacteriota bacterium]
MDKILIIGGATASGKTNLSLKISEFADIEIISADSMQIYKYMDIGSAKPSIAERSEVFHHMIDIKTPVQDFDARDFEINSKKIIKKIIRKGKIPVIVGGTGFYIEALLYGLPVLQKKNNKIRDFYEKMIEEKGKIAVFELLKSKWPERAEKLHENDTRRIIRSLEIFDSGDKENFEYNKNENFNFLFYYINTDRESLENRVKKRVENMFKNGLIEEVDFILKKTGFGIQASQGIGYKEVIPFFEKGKISDLEKIKEEIILHTLQFSKRQRTFFKNKFKKMIFLDLCGINKYQIKEDIENYFYGG